MSSNPKAPYAFSVHEAILESLHDAIVILDGAGRIEMCNQAAEQLFGRSREEMKGRPAEEFLANSNMRPNPESQSRWHNEIYERSRVGVRLDMAARHSNGQERQVEVTVADLAGDTDRHCLIICDITADRRVAIQAAKLSILQQVVTRATTTLITSSTLNDSMAEALAAIGEILDVSHAFVFRVRTFGGSKTLTTPAEWRSSKVDGSSRGLIQMDVLRDPFIRGELECDRIVSISESETAECETGALMRKHGVRSMILVPIQCPDTLEGILGFDETRSGREWSVDERAVLSNLAQALARSIERIRAQWSLEEARKRSSEALVRAEAANEAKSEFLANVSHELRTPLTAIVGYADLAGRDSTSPPDRIKMCGRIQRSADFLLGLINDILDLSKIESRKMAISLASVDLAELVSDVAMSLNWIAQDKGIEINVKYATEVPTLIISDATRLRQILVNLVSNGLKFTSEGGVTITVRYDKPPEKKDGTLSLEVADTGIGIRPEKLRELFSKFTQVHTDRKYGGTGLGLAISRHLARLLSGDVEVTSEFGKGSAFTLSLPVALPDEAQIVTEGGAAAAAATTQNPSAAIVPGTRVLIADDNEDNRQIFRLVLEEVGADITTVENGQEALDELEAAERRDEPYAMVLMDMNMPVLDGYDATRVYRRQGGKLQIVALTAFSMATDRDKCIAAGCDGYLTKPIRPEVLIREVARRTNPDGKAVDPSQAVAVRAEGETALSELSEADVSVAKPAPRLVASEEPESEQQSEGGASAAEGQSIFAGNPEYQELLEGFRGVVGKRMQKIQETFEGGDAERLRALVHQLKGSAGCYGFMDLVAVATRCENALRSGNPAESVADDVREMDRLIGLIKGEA